MSKQLSIILSGFTTNSAILIAIEGTLRVFFPGFNNSVSTLKVDSEARPKMATIVLPPGTQTNIAKAIVGHILESPLSGQLTADTLTVKIAEE